MSPDGSPERGDVTSGRRASHAGLYFLVGPLRTGSSLMARCLDDHPSAICLCESEINRALFRDYFVAHHCQRMNAHGLATEEVVAYLDRRRQDDVGSMEGWYSDIRPRLAELYDKPSRALLGDKSPDFYRSPEILHHLAAHHPLIYTVRDPRAICSSIATQGDSTAEKAERWSSLIENYRAWEPYLDDPNVLIVRYEDLVTMPGMTMRRVYNHLGLPDSSRFLLPFSRPHPCRFLWSTAIDWETGIRKDFDPSRISSWEKTLSSVHIRKIESDREIAKFMARFGYDESPNGRRGSPAFDSRFESFMTTAGGFDGTT